MADEVPLEKPLYFQQKHSFALLALHAFLLQQPHQLLLVLSQVPAEQVLVGLQAVPLKHLLEPLEPHLHLHRLLVPVGLLHILLIFYFRSFFQLVFGLGLLLEVGAVLLLEEGELIRGNLLVFGVLRVDVEDEGCEICAESDLAYEGEGVDEFALAEAFVALVGEELVYLVLGGLHAGRGTCLKWRILGKSWQKSSKTMWFFSKAEILFSMMFS